MLSQLLSQTCSSCLTLSQKIAELEGRITILHQIKEDENLLDSLVAATPSASKSKAPVGLETTVPWFGSPTGSAEGDPWEMLGAKPKTLACSTPHTQEPWSFVLAGKRKGRRTSRPPQVVGLQLSNKFQPLAPGPPRSPSIYPSTAQVGSNGVTTFTASPHSIHPQQLIRSKKSHIIMHRSQVRQQPPRERHITRERPLRQPSLNSSPPSVLLVGSSMVRHVTLPKAETLCFPGARVLDINSKLPSVLSEYPSAATVVVHVGSNDTSLQQSERLKDDFKTLIDTLLTSGKQCTISGPLPSPRYGNMKFSRIRQLHIWLKGYCSSLGIPFVDNFSTFRQRPNLFGWDGIHLNRVGSQLLALNMDLALLSGKTLST